MTSAQYRKQQGLPPPGVTQLPPDWADPRPREKPQIRLPHLREPNRTEAEYGRILESEFSMHHLAYEAITLRLPSGTRYTPDWTVWKWQSVFLKSAPQLVLVVETKGPRIHNAASIRAFKEARSAFPWLRFRFAQKRKGEWAIAE